ncbi:MAG: peptidoglycan DD-metalloendopeptidase family protein [Bacteroidia bacterium]
MRKQLEIFWKLNFTIILIGFCAFSIAQTESDSTMVTDTSVHIEPIDSGEFDVNLVPAQSIYGRSWNHTNVDSPKYDAELMKFGYLINVVEEGCEYVHPFEGRVTSKYGWRRSRWHKGIDIDLEIGDPVYAAFDGVVRIQRYNAGGYGNYVLIRHYNGLETIYGHLSKAIVQPNQTVRAGDVIGYGGSTGRSTGSHLHFETRLMGQAFDPARIIDFTTFQIKKEQVFINNTWFPYIRGNNTRANVVPAGAKRYHRIRSGDTLYGLALRYGTTVNSICRLNRISRNATLRIGRTLRVR